MLLKDMEKVLLFPSWWRFHDFHNFLKSLSSAVMLEKLILSTSGSDVEHKTKHKWRVWGVQFKNGGAFKGSNDTD